MGFRQQHQKLIGGRSLRKHWAAHAPVSGPVARICALFRFKLLHPFQGLARKLSKISIFAGLTSLVVGLVFSSQAFALGLGNLSVQSFLDEPLDIRVELIVDPVSDNLADVTFDLASREEFAIAGVARSQFMEGIQFETVQENGRHWLRIFSTGTMQEPFLHILLRADWDGGSLLREYTALIDPPVYGQQTPTPVSAPRVIEDSRQTTNYSQPDYAQETGVPESAIEDYEVTESVPVVPETSYQPDYSNDYTSDYGQQDSFAQSGQPSVDEAFGVYGPIEAGETLGQIAQELISVFPELSYYQTLYVLFRDNEQAFINGNMNLLKKGEILRLDNLNEIRDVSFDLAVQVFQSHQSTWQGYVAQGGSTPTFVANDSVSTPAANTTTGDYDYRTGGTATSAASDEFRIGSARDGGSVGGSDQDAQALRDEISELETNLLSSQLENNELRERIELLEIQLEEVNQLIALEDAGMAALQQGLRDGLGDGTENVAAQPEQASDNRIAADPATGIADTRSTQAPNNAAQPLASGNTASEPVLQPVTAADAGAADNRPAPAPLVITEKSWLDRVQEFVPDIGVPDVGVDLQSPTTLGLLGGLIALIGGLVFWRRRQARAEFEHSMLSVAIDPSSEFESEVDLSESVASQSRQPSRSKDSSFLTVFNDNEVVVHADEVDPLAEAEVYLAYGRDDQAIDVLKDGIEKHTERFDIRSKLLEIYHKREDAPAFESLAEQFYSTKGDGEAKEWQKIVTWASSLGISNPIFSDNAPEPTGAPVGDAALEVGSLIQDTQSQGAQPEPGLSLDTETALGDPPSILSDLDSSLERSSQVQEQKSGNTVDFALDDVDSTSQLSVPETSAQVERPSQFSDVVLEVESVIEEMSTADDGSVAMPDASAISLDSNLLKDTNTQDFADYGDKVAAEIETAASYLDVQDADKGEESSSVDTESLSLGSPEIESASYRPAGSIDLEEPSALGLTSESEADSMLEFDTSSISQSSSVSHSLVSEVEASIQEVGIEEASQLAEELEVLSKAAETGELDIESVSMQSESVEIDGTSTDVDIPSELEASIDQFSEQIKPAGALDDLSELSDLVVGDSSTSELAEQASRLQLDDEDVQTQLDLAQVYVELGDKEGASQILRDVMEFGDAGQKNQAKDLLSQMDV